MIKVLMAYGGARRDFGKKGEGGVVDSDMLDGLDRAKSM
jgi:hypothetical protein